MGRGRGTWDARTGRRGDTGTWERGNSGRSGRKDVINKQRLNYALNLQFSVIKRKVIKRDDGEFAGSSPWAKTPKIGFFVPIGGTSAIMEFFNLHLSKFKKIHDIKAESVAILVK